ADLDPFEKGNFIKEEEFARAVGLALFDYLRKSRLNGFTVSLSGGADSSACAALVALMIALADESIGLDRVKEKLAYVPGITDVTTIKELTTLLLETIYQATRNSSDRKSTRLNSSHVKI